MKYLASIFFSLTLGLSAISAQDIVYYDASAFPVYGKASQDTKTRYERLPEAFENVSRPPVWRLGRNSSGLYLRFRSNSTAIYARWTSLNGGRMNHMTETGIRGLDLYAMHNGQWHFAGAARPSAERESEVAIVKNMDGEYREYMLYLSLYDGVTALEIGVDSLSVIEGPQTDSPSPSHPIVAYGTSILQGGCVSRPGMAHTAILGRKTDMEVINLGFSGNAFLDFEIAELMASVPEPSLFILDYVPNTSAEMIREKGERFFRILRDAHPDVPVIFVEDPPFPHSLFDKAMLEEVTTKNKAQKELFESLESKGEKHIYYVGAEGMIGEDGEATVDGCHLTDLGTVRYVEHILPVVREALKNNNTKD